MGAVVSCTEAMIEDRIAGKGEVRGGDASAGRQGIESWGVVPSGSSDVGIRLAHCLVVKEGEDLIFPDGAAHAATELLELIVVPRWRVATIVALKGVEI